MTRADNVGAVIVHYQREADLSSLLDQLTGRHGVPASRIVVVNNGGDESTLTDIRTGTGVGWLDLDNPGYGAAVNAGVEALPPEAELVLVLTHEVSLEAGGIEALASAIADPLVGLVGPLLLNPGKGTIWSAGGVTSPVRRMPRHLRSGTSTRPTGPVDAQWLDGSCFLVRRSDFDDLGGLDETFFLYFEDVDLGWRVRRELALSVRCTPTAIAYQSPGGHLDQFYATRNLLWLLRKQRQWLAYVLYSAETLVRLTLGTALRPRGSRARQSKRWAGFTQGLRKPSQVS